MNRRIGIPILLALGLVVLEPGRGVVQARAADDSPPELQETAQELEDLRHRIRASRRRAAALAQDEKQQVARLAELDREASLTEELLAGLEAREAEVQARMDELQAQIDSLSRGMEERQASLARRLRQMYMRPGHSMVAAALGSEDFSQMTARLRAMRHFARTERRMLDGVLASQRELAVKKNELEARSAEIQLNRSEARDRQDRLETLRQERAGALEEIREKKRNWTTTTRELESAAERLEQLMADLENRRRQQAKPLEPGTGGDFAEGRGRLPWPVRGRVIKGFGPYQHPEFDTRVVNKGINVAAPMGAPIQALHAGVVDFVDWLPGYGQCIIVNHGDGYYSLYAHASAIFPGVGAEVEAGEVIGEVGDSGSLDGSQLYLEIRHGKKPLDPALWLSPR